MRSTTVTLVALLAVLVGACHLLNDNDDFSYESDAAAGSGGAGGASSLGGHDGPGGSDAGCDPASCPGIDEPCRARACRDGQCDFEDAPAYAPCDTPPGGRCDGAGQCVECLEPSHCGAGETCNVSDCVPLQCVDGVQNGQETDVDCGGDSCSACANGKTCGAADDCTSRHCDDGTCAPCTTDTDCSALAYCELTPSGGICTAKRATGDVCSSPNQCVSGFCPTQDGVCCATLCAAKCQACIASKTGQNNGICSLVDPTLDPDPDDECGLTPASTCGSNGAGCSGTAPACILHSASTVCALAGCTGSTLTSSSTCDGAGTCDAGTTTSCAPYQCSTSSAACKTSCLTDIDCTAQAYCNLLNNCSPKKGNGAACTTDNQCQDGFCVDGVCCNTPCSGTCVACSSSKTGAPNGTCAPVPYAADPDAECPGFAVCDGAGSCLCAGIGSNKPLGTCCALGSECSSGHCADGLCCDAACSGACESCDGGDTGRADGICSFVPSGDDPAGECSSQQVCDGAGTCSTCFAASPPAGGACPAQCTGGCIDGGKTCVIDCLGNNACKGTIVACPPGFSCDVRCGFKGCQDAVVQCPTATTACAVSCQGAQGCRDAQIQCGGGPCDLTCGNVTDACLGTDLTCGSRACSAVCDGSSQPLVACGSACSCEAC